MTKVLRLVRERRAAGARDVARAARMIRIGQKVVLAVAAVLT